MCLPSWSRRALWPSLFACVLLLLTVGPASSLTACGACGASHGTSVAACGQCLITLLFEMLGGW